MTDNIRRQVTLFVETKDAEQIEHIRQEFNPLQFEIIKAHVTLCREDEIQNLEQIVTNLSILTQPEFIIEFGKVARFDNGKGLLLPAMTDNGEFQELRRKVLVRLTENPRKQEPHITLMHPRNSNCTNHIFEQIEKISLPRKLRFKKISVIEQVNGGQWKILKEFAFTKRT